MASRAPTPPIKDIVISSRDPELVEILKEIKQLLDIREGRLGDDGFRFVDYYELVELLTGDETITVTVLPAAHTHIHDDLTAVHQDVTTTAEPTFKDLTLDDYGVTSIADALAALDAVSHPPDIIAEGNSSVEVVDPGTGEIRGTVDGLQVFKAWNDAGFGRFLAHTTLSAGTQDTQAGFLYLYGHASPTGAGGQIALFCDEDTYPTIVGYIIQPVDGDLRIGPAAIQDALLYDSATDHWHFKQTINLLSGLLETDPSTPLDLTIDCGTQKTVVLQETVWKDINVGAAQLDPIPAFAPTQDTFDDEAGVDTLIQTLSFGVNDRVSGAFEIQHDYKEGSDISFHVHWQGKTAPSGTDNVRWRLIYTISEDGTTLDATRTIEIETPIDTQYEFYRSVFPTISGSTGGPNGGPIGIGNQFLFQLRRITATGDAYAGGALIATAGLHYQVDTMGSRQIGVK